MRSVGSGYCNLISSRNTRITRLVSATLILVPAVSVLAAAKFISPAKDGRFAGLPGLTSVSLRVLLGLSALLRTLVEVASSIFFGRGMFSQSAIGGKLFVQLQYDVEFIFLIQETVN